MDDKEKELLNSVYDKLSKLGIDKWVFSEEDDTHYYVTSVGNLAVEVSSHYGRRSGDNATLKILDRGKSLEVYQLTEEKGRIFNLYNRLKNQHLEKESGDSERKRCAPLEQLLDALEGQGKPKKAKKK